MASAAYNRLNAVGALFAALWVEIVIAVLGVALSAVFYSQLEQAAKSLQPWLDNHRYVSAAAITGAVVFLGWVAYSWKKLHQRSYGLTEIIFGASLTYNTALAVRPQRATLAQALALASSLYVVSRGIANMAQAEKPPRL
jgi:hypothetical protein